MFSTLYMCLTTFARCMYALKVLSTLQLVGHKAATYSARLSSAKPHQYAKNEILPL